jgi:hypothetical protein
MIRDLSSFWLLIKDNASRIIDSDFSQIQFGDTIWPYIMGMLVLVVIASRFVLKIFKKTKHSRKESGHSLISSYYRQGAWERFRYYIPQMLLLSVIALVLIVLARPYINDLVEVDEVIDSRLRIDLRDTSTSMSNRFTSDTGKSRAQVAAEAHLEFIKMRRGQKDRVSFWLFASHAYMIQEFIVDDDLYYLDVYDSPWVTFDNCPIDESKRYQLVPGSRCARITGDSGGTRLKLALSSIIRYVQKDQEESRGISEGSILIVTDAGVNEFPDGELEQLARMNIVPYIMLISSAASTIVPRLAMRVSDYGGKYFDVRDPNALFRAYQEINRLERSETRIRKFTNKRDLFQLFLSIAVAGIFFTVLTGMIVELLWPQYP